MIYEILFFLKKQLKKSNNYTQKFTKITRMDQQLQFFWNF